MSNPPGVTLEDFADYWKKGWEGRKEKMTKKAGQREVQEVWRTHAASVGAERAFKEEVIKAAEEGRRAKRILETDPAKWGTDYVTAIRVKELTPEEKARYIKNAGPYVTLVRRVRGAYRAAGLSGIDGGQFWLKEISARLEKARMHPEKLPDIEREIMEALRAKAAELGVVIAIP